MDNVITITSAYTVYHQLFVDVYDYGYIVYNHETCNVDIGNAPTMTHLISDRLRNFMSLTY